MTYAKLSQLQRKLILAARKECLVFRNRQAHIVPPFVRYISPVVQANATDKLVDLDLITLVDMPDGSGRWACTPLGMDVAGHLARGNT
jgi:hypothetical protein